LAGAFKADAAEVKDHPRLIVALRNSGNTLAVDLGAASEVLAFAQDVAQPLN
jgi:hypothetical protein